MSHVIHTWTFWWVRGESSDARNMNTCTSHGTHPYESCHTYKWVMSPVTHTTWVISHIPMSYIPEFPDKNQGSRATHATLILARVMSHKPMSHVTHTNESCHKYLNFLVSTRGVERRTQHEYLHESWHTSTWVMPHIQMSHESCHTYDISHDTNTNVIHTWISW